MIQLGSLVTDVACKRDPSAFSCPLTFDIVREKGDAIAAPITSPSESFSMRLFLELLLTAIQNSYVRFFAIWGVLEWLTGSGVRGFLYTLPIALAAEFIIPEDPIVR